MRFVPTTLAGAVIVEPELREDPRGFFARTFCSQEFEAQGLVGRVVQCSISFSCSQATLRGLHYQEPPAAEVKLVRCTRGAIHDVIVDLRPKSATYLHHFGVELTPLNRRALYVPELFAHGFLTLADDTEVLYQMSEFFAPALARGIRYDDPLLDIQWPMAPAVVSEKDTTWPLLSK